MIRRTDPLIAADRVAVAEAQRDAAVQALADVMRTLERETAGPRTSQVWARARQVLADAGVSGAEAAEHHAAYAEWEVRAAAREAARAHCQHVHPEHGGSLVFDGRCLRCGVKQ